MSCRKAQGTVSSRITNPRTTESTSSDFGRARIECAVARIVFLSAPTGINKEKKEPTVICMGELSEDAIFVTCVMHGGPSMEQRYFLRRFNAAIL